MRDLPKSEIERAATHFDVPVEGVTPEMITELPPRGTGLSESRIEEIARSAAKEGNPMTPDEIERVWIRMGDVAEYESFDTPSDAGLAVGQRIGLGKPKPLAFHYQSAGVAIPPSFVGNNYISLFWGDKDAQWTRDLTNVENRRFEEGVGKGILE